MVKLIMVGGYCQKLLHIDLSTLGVKEKPLDMQVARLFLGGRGLAAKILYDETKPKMDPLDPENPLIFATGPLTGAPLSGAVKFVVATKSPMTGTITDASCSGFLGPQLKFAGYDAVIFKGKAKGPIYVSITDDGADFRSAKHLWGKNTHETDKEIKEELKDENASIAAIGQAGERLVRYANISVDLWRHPARGGTGTIMGSKNLKAVAVHGTKRISIEDSASLNELAVELNEILTRQINRWGMPHNIVREGTNEYLDVEIETGVTPWRNYQTITPTYMQDELKAHTIANRSCPGCIQTCWCVRTVREGPYAGTEGVGPEYESLSTLGPVCAISDIPTIIRANLLCNLYGIDTISTGACIAFAMECYEKGILTKDDVGGLDLQFGNGEAMVKMVEMISRREGIGRLLGEGVMRASQKIGKGSEKYAIHTKGLEYPGYLPKAFPGMALAFATADRGACHLRAWISEEVFQRTLTVDPKKVVEYLKGKGKLVADTQNNMAWLHSIGMCQHVSYFFGYPLLPKILKAVVGWDLAEEGLNKIGERIYNQTRLFNAREGFSRKDDNLPWRFTHEPLPDGPMKGMCIRPEHLNAMLDEYYEARGWSSDGIPTEAKLKELELKPVID